MDVFDGWVEWMAVPCKDTTKRRISLGAAGSATLPLSALPPPTQPNLFGIPHLMQPIC